MGVPMVAIIINNPDLDVLQLDVKGSSHVMAVQVVMGSCEFYLISAYFQFSHPVEPYLALLESCIARIKRNNSNNQVIITADVNASSASWYSRTTDERGDMIEEFIAANNLMVLNQASRFTTYASLSGTSNIDVFLATPGIAGYISDWRISPDMTISDHNAILFKLLPHRTRATQTHPSDFRFNIKRSNWERFDEELRGIASSSFKRKLSLLPPQQAANLLVETLQEVCRRIFGIKRIFCRSVPWWNARFSALRRKTQSA